MINLYFLNLFNDTTDSEVPEDEIEALLDERLPDSYKGPPKKRECPYDQRQKLVLEGIFSI